MAVYNSDAGHVRGKPRSRNMTDPHRLSPPGCCEYCGAPMDEYGCSADYPIDEDNKLIYRTWAQVHCKNPKYPNRPK